MAKARTDRQRMISHQPPCPVNRTQTERRSEIKMPVEKLMFNFLLIRREEVLKSIGFFDQCKSEFVEDKLCICGEDNEENRMMWDTFQDLYEEIQEMAIIESITLTSRFTGRSLVENLQKRFDCICTQPNDNEISFDIICLKEDLQEIRQFVDTFRVNHDFERTDPMLTVQQATSPTRASGYLQDRLLNNDGDVTLPRGFDVGGTYQVFIHEADVRQLHVDAVVNSANGALRHGSGIAKAIKDSAGPQLEMECKEIIRKQKSVRMGEVVRTTAGKLPAKMVLHTVGPRWPMIKRQSAISGCVSKLERTFYNVISAAEYEDVQSIAIPPISSGVYKVPAEHVAHTLFSAIMEKAASCNHQKNIHLHLVDINHSILEMVAQKFNTVDDKTVTVRQLSNADVHNVLKTVLPGNSL